MVIKSILEKAKSENSLVSIYLDSDDWGCCSVGYVDSLTDDHVRLKAIASDGGQAGFEIRPIIEIFKIEFSGKYEKKIQLLSENHEKVFNEILPQVSTSGDLIQDALEQSLDENILIVIWGQDQDDSLVGYVEKLDKGLVTLQLINEFGEADGFSVMLQNEITSVDFNTRSEQIRDFLYCYAK